MPRWNRSWRLSYLFGLSPETIWALIREEYDSYVNAVDHYAQMES